MVKQFLEDIIYFINELKFEKLFLKNEGFAFFNLK